MEAYLQYRRVGQSLQKQLECDVEDARKLPCLSRQETRHVNGMPVLVVDWDGPDDPLNPRNWSFLERFSATMILSAIGYMVGAAASIDSAVLPQAAQELHVSHVTESLAVGIFLIGFGFGALICGPFSEVVGRSLTYLVSLAFMCIFIMASALSPNIGAQVTFRFIAGFCGATPLVCAGGSISDMYSPLEKTYMFPIFALAGFGGPPLGPVIGAWIADSFLSWRWVEWVSLLTAGLVMFLTFFFQPETYPPLLLSWKAKHLRRLTDDPRYWSEHEINLQHVPVWRLLVSSLPRPFVMAFQEPIILLITLYMSILYIILFTFFGGYDYIFRQTYNISQGLSNTIFVAMSIGIFSGGAVIPWIYRRTVSAQRKAESQGKPQFDPEERLWFAIIGAPTIPISIPIYENVGHHWTLTIMAGLSLLMTPIPYVFYLYGHVIREKGPFARNQSAGAKVADLSSTSPSSQTSEEDLTRES